MTVASTSNRKTYTGNGVTTSFTTSPVVFFATSDLKVYVVTTATGAATLLTENTHYTATGGSGSTGTVDLSGGASPYGAPSASQTLVIVRDLPLTQEVDFVNNEASDADVAEQALDRLTMFAQQLSARLDRAFALPATDVSGASTALPTPTADALIGWDAAGTALENKIPVDIDLATVSAFISTLLDDADAATARTTLGALSSAAGAVAAANLAASAVTAAKLDASTMGFSLVNGTLVASQNGTVLTVAVKTKAGNDPSAADPVYVLFRNSASGTGDYTVITLTAATSISTTVGGTFGVANNVPFRLWVVGFNDAGTFRLGLINCLTTVAGAGAGRDVTAIYPLGQFPIASSTQIGAGSTSAGVFYTAGAAVAAKAYAVLAYLTYESGLAVAGTFNVNQSRLHLQRVGDPLPGQVIQTQRTDTGALATGTNTLTNSDTIPQNTAGDQYMAQAITPMSGANALRVQASAVLSNSAAASTGFGCYLFQDSTANALKAKAFNIQATQGMFNMLLDAMIQALGTTSTTFKVRAGASNAGTTTFNGQGGGRLFALVANSYTHVDEVMT